MAQALAEREAKRRGIAVDVRSSGFLTADVPAVGGAVQAMRSEGLDLMRHLSVVLDADQLRSADLVLTMERRHLLGIADLDSEAVRRSFTLPEFAVLASMVGRRSRGQPISSWVGQVTQHRTPDAAFSPDSDLDVTDPTGGSRRAFRPVVRRLDADISTVFDHLFPNDR